MNRLQKLMFMWGEAGLYEEEQTLHPKGYQRTAMVQSLSER